MLVSNIVFDIIEVSIMMFFMVYYFDLRKYRKYTVLFFILLFASVILCDLIKQNGSILAIVYFFITLSYLYVCQRKITFFDVFVLGVYVGFVFLIPITLAFIVDIIIPKDMYAYSLSFLLIASLSKGILFLFSFLFIRYKKYILFENKFNWLIIFVEILVLLSYAELGHAIILENNDRNTYIFIYLSLMIVFIFIIIYGIYLNKLYQEKIEYEKNKQKEFYIKQSLQLIENVKFNIDNKEHRMYWIMEKIKMLIQENKIDEMNRVIKEFNDNYKSNQKMIHSQNPYFDTVLSWKINELYLHHIDVKPLLQLTKSDKYEDIDYMNTITQILNYIKDDSKVTLNIKDQNLYIIVELYAKDDFYLKDQLKIKDYPLIIKSQYHDEEELHVVKFILGEENE